MNGKVQIRTTYALDGESVTQCAYKDGRRHGRLIQFDAKFVTRCVMHFEEDVLHGIGIKYTPNYALVTKWEKGKLIYRQKI